MFLLLEFNSCSFVNVENTEYKNYFRFELLIESYSLCILKNKHMKNLYAIMGLFIETFKSRIKLFLVFDL